MLVRFTLPVALISCATSTASASLVFVSQVRHVEVRDFAPTVSADSTDFGLFSRSVSWTDPLEGHGGSAFQRSELLGDQISFDSNLTARDGRSGFLATASSRLDVSFVIDAPTGADLRGSWSFFTPTSGVSLFATVRLSRNESVVWQTAFNRSQPPTAPMPIEHFGELAPGAYRLELQSDLTANLSPGLTSGTGSLSMTFQIPGPGGAAAFGIGSLALASRRRRGW